MSATHWDGSLTRVIVPAPNVARCPKIRSARPCGKTTRRPSALNGRAGRQRTGSDCDQCPAFSTVSVSTSVHGRFRHIAFQWSVTVRHLLAGSVRSTKIDADEENGPSSNRLTEHDFHDLANAYLTRAHSQNVLYAEMFFDPQAHTTRGIAFDSVIRGIRRAQVDAQDKLGIRTQLIMCFLRDMSAESAMATLEQSLPYKDWIVGVGLDSDEKGNPPVKFKAVFARARAEGYRLTMHCDVDQEDSTRHIR